MKKEDIQNYLLSLVLYNPPETAIQRQAGALTEAVRIAIYVLELFDLAHRKDNIKRG